LLESPWWALVDPVVAEVPLDDEVDVDEVDVDEVEAEVPDEDEVVEEGEDEADEELVEVKVVNEGLDTQNPWYETFGPATTQEELNRGDDVQLSVHIASEHCWA